MELKSNNSTITAPKPKGIINPNTGELIGSDDKFFVILMRNYQIRVFSYLNRCFDYLGAHWFSHVDEFWFSLLCC